MKNGRRTYHTFYWCVRPTYVSSPIRRTDLRSLVCSARGRGKRGQAGFAGIAFVHFCFQFRSFFRRVPRFEFPKFLPGRSWEGFCVTDFADTLATTMTVFRFVLCFCCCCCCYVISGMQYTTSWRFRRFLVELYDRLAFVGLLAIICVLPFLD